MPRALMIIAAALLATATAAADPSSSPPWAKGLLSRFAAAVNTSGHSDPRLPLVVSVRPGQEALLRFICGPVKAAFSGPRCRDLLKSSCDHAYTSPGLLGWSGSYSQAELRALHNCAPLLMTLVEHDGHVRASASASSVNSSPLSNSAVAASAAGSPPASLPTLGPPMSPPWNLDRVNQARMPLDGSFSAPATAGAGVTVYVVDTGVRSSHSEFLPRGGGRSRASLGADFVRDATTAACPPAAACDCDGHGTHVSGVVAGLSTGIAPSARIVSVRVLDCSGNGNISDVLAGLDYIAANARPPAVVTLSLGVPKGSWSVALAQAVTSLVQMYGIVVVVAAGNGAGDSCGLVPASVPDAITVGATSLARYFFAGGLPPTGTVAGSDSLYSWTDTGACVSIFAPGVNVLSACGGVNRCAAPSDASYALATGTSMAAPHVAGGVAALLSAQPGLSPAAVRAALLASATAGVLPNATMLPNTPNLLLYIQPPVSGVWQTVAQAMAAPAGRRALVR